MGESLGWLNAVDNLEEDEMRAEGRQLMAGFENDLEEIQKTRNKLTEISTVMSVFATKIEEQHEMIEDINDNADSSIQYVESAAKHLNRAASNQTSYRFYVCCWFVGSALFLLVFDFFDSRMPI